jgi:hypothetical protein
MEHKNFNEIKELFVKFFEACGNSFTKTELDEVRRFTNVGEYGLALETITGIYFEEKKVPSTQIIKIVNELASQMEFDPLPSCFHLIE